MHRSGSSFLHSICMELCKEKELAYYSPNRGANFLFEVETLTQESFWLNKEGCIGPVRWFASPPDIDKYKIALHLRDPRDVLVSMFFSYCYKKEKRTIFEKVLRQIILLKGIDRFVLSLTQNIPKVKRHGTGRSIFMGNILERYVSYVKHLVGKPHVILLRYEDMVANFPEWLEKLIALFDISKNNPLVLKLVKKHDKSFTVDTEKKTLHKRQCAHGDYKVKLKKKTISELNERFADVLEKLGYEI